MDTKPPRRNDDDEDATPYGVAFEAPHTPPAIEYPPEDDDFVTPANAPRKKKKRNRPAADGYDSGPAGEPSPKRRPDILEREELPPAIPWWAEAAAVAGVGLLLTLVAVVVVAANVKQANLAVGVFLLVGVAVAVVVETAAVTAGLFVAGNLFGIDYGPAKEALVKLAAVVLLVDGVTLAGSLMCVPVGLVAGSLVGGPAFWRLFKVGLQETFVSVGVMVVPAWVLAAAIFATKLSKATPQ